MEPLTYGDSCLQKLELDPCLKMSAKVLILATVVALCHGHGFMRFPLSRTSIQTRPEFNTQQPYWWDHQGVWCGNVNQNMQYSTCGRCGDVYGEHTAEQDGIYDKKTIVATFNAGSVIEIEAEFGANHYGHYHIELCAQERETDNCFQRLTIVSGSRQVREGNRVCTTNGEGDLPEVVTARVQLPAGVRCERCTLRWTYRTSYPGHCSDPARDWCDNPCLTQTFRNCADVKIV